MEPLKTNTGTPQPRPVNDITPLPKSVPVMAAPAVPAGPGSAMASKLADMATPPPKPAKAPGSKQPVAALSFAVLFFVALAAVAYYAYTRSN